MKAIEFLFLLTGFLSFSSCVTTEPATKQPAPKGAPAHFLTHFKDANLEAAIRMQLKKPVGPITRKDVASLEKLGAPGTGITDLTGLEYATKLTRLYLSGNQITDLTPLSEITSLNVMNLRQNQITDITPLLKLTNLTELNLSANKITDDQKEILGKALPNCSILF